MSNTHFIRTVVVSASLALTGLGLVAHAQTPASSAAQQTPPEVRGPVATVPVDYVIGPEDVIGVMFWRETEMTADVTVRPDGMITLPLLGDIVAAGLKPDVLSSRLQQAASKYLSDPNATVVVRQVNSRKVFITGEVRTAGAFPIVAPRTVLQVIALAGGLTEYAQADKITIMRGENGTTKTLKFNYKDVSKGKHLEQNIQLQPGDTIVVP